MPLVQENVKSRMVMNFPHLVPHSSFEDMLKTLNPRQIVTKESPTGAGMNITTYALEESIEEEKTPIVPLVFSDEDSPKYYLEKPIHRIPTIERFETLPCPSIYIKENLRFDN